MSQQMPVNLSNFTTSELDEWLRSFDTIFCDCDGVIWLHDTLFPLANDAINKLVELGKQIFLVTNNSQTTRADMLKKCAKMDFKLSIESMMTTSYATALYLQQVGFDKKAFVIGSEALGRELDIAGIEHFGIGADHLEGPIVEFVLKKFKLEEGVGAVLVGFDGHFSYVKLIKAVNYLCDADVKFIATNPDNAYQFPWFLLPEAGPLVSAIENATGRKATVIGKPSKFIFDVIEKSNPPFNLERTLMIGDRLDVDVVFGKSCGLKTLFVESGHDKMKMLEDIVAKINGGDEELKKMLPDFTASHIGDIFKILTNKI